MVKDISVLVCSQSCRSDSILQKSDAFTSNRLSRKIKAVIAISRSFALQKNSRIYEFFYSQRLLRHDFNNFCSMWNKNRLSQQNICFANNLTCRTGCLYQAELLNLHRLRFCLLLYRSFQRIFSYHENTALHRTTRSASEVAPLIRTTKGQLPLKILQIFFFQITCQDILFGAKLEQKNGCDLVCLSVYAANNNTFLPN